MKLELLKYPLHVIVHPLDGFWDLKYEQKGRLKIAFLILFLLALVQIIQKQFAGYLVNYNDPRFLNSIDEFKFILIPFFLWSISNWSVTALMDGEGKFTEIMMVTGYSVLPFVLIYLPTTVLSNFMIAEETAFYYLFNAAAGVWFLCLMFVGTMTIHQYSPGKTIATMLLTVVCMGIIIFLGLLIFSLVNQVSFFFQTLYREIVFWS